MSTKCSSGAVPGGVFGYFAATGKVTRRPQTAELPQRSKKKSPLFQGKNSGD